MMLSQLTPPMEIASWLACAAFLIMLANGVLKLVDRAKGRPTPGEVRDEASNRYAGKLEFERHVAHNTDRHSQLFSNIERVERDARVAMESRFTALNDERRQTLERLNEQFTFIRESIAAINRELQIRQHK